jgi:hypothetical protein
VRRRITSHHAASRRVVTRRNARILSSERDFAPLASTGEGREAKSVHCGVDIGMQ